MAYTLSEAAKLSNDVLQAGVIELFVRDDPVLERLPFVDIVGNGLTYNVETTEPTVNFYEVGDTWVESTGTVTQTTAVLRILGGDADLDNFLKATRSNINDLKAEMIASKVKALRHQFMTSFIYGNNTRDPKQFDGIHTLINSATYNTVPVGTADSTPAVLSMAKLEETIDMVKGWKPDLMLMSKGIRRRINTYLRAAGGITYDDLANKRVQTIFGIPVGATDYIRDTEDVGHDYVAPAFHGYDVDGAQVAEDATTIFILTFDPKACCGTQNGTITITPLGDLETKDASRYRIKWYCSAMLQSIISCAKITGITAAGVVTA